MSERFKNHLPEGEPLALVGAGMKKNKALDKRLHGIRDWVKSGRGVHRVTATPRLMHTSAAQLQLDYLDMNVDMTHPDFGTWVMILGIMLKGRDRVFEVLGEEDELSVQIERIYPDKEKFEFGVSAQSKLDVNGQCLGYIYPDGQRRDTPVFAMTKTQAASTYRAVLESCFPLGCGDFVMPHGLYDTGYPIEEFAAKKLDGRAEVTPQGTLKSARWVDAKRICYQRDMRHVQSRIKQYFHMSG